MFSEGKRPGGIALHDDRQGKKEISGERVKENIFHGQDVKLRNFRLFCSVITPVESRLLKIMTSKPSLWKDERNGETIPQYHGAVSGKPPAGKLIDLCSEL